MPIFEIETDQGVFEIDADREPTMEEALQAISRQSVPAPKQTPLSLAPEPKTEQQAIDEFIKSKQAPFAQQVSSKLGDVLSSLIVEPLKAAGGVVTGVAQEAINTPPPTAIEAAQPFGTPFARNIGQTVLESGGRLAFDVGNQVNQMLQKAAEDPLQAYFKTAVAPMMPLAQLADFFPRTPSQGEVDQMLRERQRAEQVAAVKSEPLVPEVIGEANLPLANDIELAGTTVAPALRPLGRGVGAAAGAARRGVGAIPEVTSNLVSKISPRIGERIAPATVEQSAIAALDFTPEQVQMNIPVVTQRVAQIVGKTPKTAQEAIQFMDDAKKQLYEERLEVNTVAENAGYVAKGDEAIQAAEDVLTPLTTITEAKKKSILDGLRDLYSGDKKPSQAQRIQQDLNDKFSAAYENGTIDRADPAFQAERAIRDAFAGQMDEINKAVTGLDDTPYSDIGSLIEVRGALADKLNRLKKTEAARKTGIEAAPGKLPTTRVGAATKAGRTILTPFQRTQIQKLDDNISRIFTESEMQAPAQQLTQAEVNALQQSKVPANDLETQIQNLIRSYPANIRSNPYLSRAVAEQELGLR